MYIQFILKIRAYMLNIVNLYEQLFFTNITLTLFMSKGSCVFTVGHFPRLKTWAFAAAWRKNSPRTCRNIVNI